MFEAARKSEDGLVGLGASKGGVGGEAVDGIEANDPEVDESVGLTGEELGGRDEDWNDGSPLRNDLGKEMKTMREQKNPTRQIRHDPHNWYKNPKLAAAKSIGPRRSTCVHREEQPQHQAQAS